MVSGRKGGTLDRIDELTSVNSEQFCGTNSGDFFRSLQELRSPPGHHATTLAKTLSASTEAGRAVRVLRNPGASDGPSAATSALPRLDCGFAVIARSFA
jgi:hypothetical protein